MLNKKIASEFAVGIIVVLAVIIGSIFVFQNEKRSSMERQENYRNIKNKKQSMKTSAAPESSEGKTETAKNANNNACAPRLFEGDVEIRGSYVLGVIPGSTKKEWLFKIVAGDMSKLPPQTLEKGTFDGLLFITDATPEIVEKLKKATEAKPFAITIKRFYLDCGGVPVVSTELTGDKFLKYIKK